MIACRARIALFGWLSGQARSHVPGRRLDDERPTVANVAAMAAGMAVVVSHWCVGRARPRDLARRARGPPLSGAAGIAGSDGAQRPIRDRGILLGTAAGTVRI